MRDRGHLRDRRPEALDGPEDIAAEPAELLARGFQVSCRQAVNGSVAHLLHQISLLQTHPYPSVDRRVAAATPLGVSQPCT